jgi:hypothetical protein
MYRWQGLLYQAQMSCLHVSIYQMLITFSLALCVQSGNGGYGVTESAIASIKVVGAGFDVILVLRVVQLSMYCFCRCPLLYLKKVFGLSHLVSSVCRLL